MKLLAIKAHPSSESLNHTLLEAVKRGAKQGKHKLQVVDLYAEKFNPVLSQAELKGKMDPKVKKYQQMLREADWVIFVYPIWWFRAPAILEGWFDKVFTVHFAFKYKKITKKMGIPIGLLPVKKAVVVETYGSPGWALRSLYFDLPWRRMKRGLLKFCGIKKIKRFSCFSAPYASKKRVQHWERKLETLIAGLK